MAAASDFDDWIELELELGASGFEMTLHPRGMSASFYKPLHQRLQTLKEHPTSWYLTTVV